MHPFMGHKAHVPVIGHFQPAQPAPWSAPDQQGILRELQTVGFIDRRPRPFLGVHRYQHVAIHPVHLVNATRERYRATAMKSLFRGPESGPTQFGRKVFLLFPPRAPLAAYEKIPCKNEQQESRENDVIENHASLALREKSSEAMKLRTSLMVSV